MAAANEPENSNTSTPNPSNIDNWTQIASILSTTSNNNFKPTRAETTALLPNTFANVIKKRHLAYKTSLQRANTASTNTSQNEAAQALSHQLVKETLTALQKLRQHYDRLLADPIRLRDALLGFDQNSVAWVSPDMQGDFLSFVNALYFRWGNSDPSSDNTIPHLVEWAMQPNIDHDLLHAQVDSSAMAYQTIEHAFQTFQLALNDMVELHTSMDHVHPT